MKNPEQDLAQVLKFMRDHSLKLSRRSKEFLLKEFPGLSDEIIITAQEKLENSKRQEDRRKSKKS